MALTLNQFVGFETGGTEEAAAISGTPDATEPTIVRSGGHALRLSSAGAEEYDFDLFGEVANAGTDHVFGFGVYLETALPSSDVPIAYALDADGLAFHLIMTLKTDGKINLLNAGSSVAITGTIALVVGNWNYVELYFENTNSAISEMFINGSSAGTGSADDLLAGTLGQFRFNSTTNLGGDIIFDDFYWLSGATAATDRLGSGFSVIAYQIGATDKTSDVEDDASASGGNWVTTGDRPWSDEADGSSITFENTGNLQGAVFFDAANTAGVEGGPAFGSSIVSGTIVGAKYMWRADRGTGSGKTHTLYYGSDNDTTTTLAASNSIANIAGPTSTTPANFFAVSENATIIPAATDNFAMGAGKSATGGQDTYIKEMMACLAHVSDVTVTDLSDGLMPEYPSPGLTVEV